jgi:predicted transcriptional regulator
MTAHRQVRVAGDGETASGHAELDRRSRAATARMERTAEPVRRADRGRLRLAPDRRVDSPTRGAAADAPALDQVLELLERRGLSASELRVLLAVRNNEVTVSELSRTLGRPPVEIRRTGARLYALGLLRWRHDTRTTETVLGATGAGLTAVRPLTAAAGPQM